MLVRNPPLGADSVTWTVSGSVGRRHPRCRRTAPSARWSNSLGPRPVEGEFHILRIHRRAVVEGHALVQPEGIDQPVVGNLPAFGQRRRNGAIGQIARQALVDIGIDHLVDGRCRAARRIEVRRLEHHAEGQRGLRGRERGAEARPAARIGRRMVMEILPETFIERLTMRAAFGKSRAVACHADQATRRSNLKVVGRVKPG